MDHRHLAAAMFAALLVAACARDGNPSSGTYDDAPPVEATTSIPPNEDLGPLVKGPQPSFGATVTQADAPPPLSGGTLLLTEDQTLAIAADPDRDQVYVVTLADQKVLTIPLSKHDEPGRVVADAAGRAHVVLRGGGAIATIDIATGTLLSRRAVCAAPRGIAFDGTGDGRLLVACEGGEVVSVGTAPDAVPTAFAKLDRDLRDIVLSGARIFVSRFREAEIIELGPTGSTLSRTHLADGPGGESARLAWRMLPPAPRGASGDPVVVHQMATSKPVATAPGGYGGGENTFDGACASTSIVTSTISRGRDRISLPTHAVLPVDIASDGASFAIIAAGNGHTKELPQEFVATVQPGNATAPNCTPHPLDVRGQATSIALRIDASGIVNYVVQSREPAQLELLPSGVIIPLSSASREDTGHAIFHSNSGAGLACATCHGEGGDDGHVWTFRGIGARRTPSMRGTLQGTAPYHWNGEMTDLSMLLDDVMTGRMNGPSLDARRKDALQSWLFALPAPSAPPADAAATARGRSLFESSAVGCASCHSGPRYTNARTADVGTGGSFKIPSLIGVGARAPYLHNGCAPTLHDRFGACGGTKHGTTSQLAPGQIDDLVTYLGTL